MTVEQALVYFLAAIAAIFLFLGLAQALDDPPSRPRRRRADREPRRTDEDDASGDAALAAPRWSSPRSAAHRTTGVEAAADAVEAAPGVASPSSFEPAVRGDRVDAPSRHEEVASGATAPESTARIEPIEREATSAPGESTAREDVAAREAVSEIAPPRAEVPPRASAVESSQREPSPRPERRARSAPRTEPAARDDEARPVASTEPAPEWSAVEPQAPAPAAREAAPARMPKRAATRSLSDPDLVLIERAVDHCLGGRHEDLLTAVESRLDQGAQAGAERASHVMTALCSLAGLAHDGLRDAAGARAAFAAGVRSMPDPDALACPPRLAALSVRVARALLDVAARPVQSIGAPRPDEQVDAARLATFWLGWRLHAAPGDDDALALLDTAREAVADAHAERANALIGRQEFAAARDAVQRGIDAGEMPATRGEVLNELIGATFRREIDRLTTPAIRGGRDEGRAVTGLGQAEALLGALPDGTIGPAHRAAVAQRIWRAHSKLGFRRLRMGQLDAAADTLFRALSIREIGRRRQRQVRDALVRTLEALGEQRSAAVAALVAEGKHSAAAEEIARLEFRMRRAREEGVSEEELEVAAAKVASLRRSLDERSAPAR